MKGLLPVIIVMGLLLSTTAFSKKVEFTPTPSACRVLQDELDIVRDEMREGYGYAEGERLRDQERTIKAKMRMCEKKRMPTRKM